MATPNSPETGYMSDGMYQPSHLVTLQFHHKRLPSSWLGLRYTSCFAFLE